MRHRRAILGVFLVLAALGGGPTPAAGAVGAWTPLPPLDEPQTVAHLTALPDGRALASGTAVVPGGTPRTTAARYDPATGRWETRTPLPFVNGQGFATLPAVATLADGQLLYSGGATFSRGGVLAAAQRYDPDTDRWTTVAPLTVARADHAAVALPDGTALALGGITTSAIYKTTPTAATERYDPAGDRWAGEAPPPAALGAPLTARLRDGRVLVVGAMPHTPPPPGQPETSSPRVAAARYDPVATPACGGREVCPCRATRLAHRRDGGHPGRGWRARGQP